MNKNILLVIAIVSALICVSPIVAAENNAFSDYALFGLKFIGGDSHDNLTVNDLKIEKVKTEHTDSNGKTDKKTDFFLKFKVKSDLEITQLKSIV